MYLETRNQLGEGPSYRFQACGEESITGPWLLQPLPACQGMLEAEVVIAQVIKGSSALPLWLLKAIVVRDKYSCLPTVICFLLALFFLAWEEELWRLLSRIWECCGLMRLAVALGTLWNTLVLRSVMSSGPFLFLLLPQMHTWEKSFDGAQKAGTGCPGPGPQGGWRSQAWECL